MGYINNLKMTWYKTLRNFGIILKDFFWFMDSDKRERRSVMKYLKLNTKIALLLVNDGQLPFFKKDLKNQELVMKKIYKWVYDRWYWKSDWDNYKKVEWWEDIDVALDMKAIDCETMATVIYCLAKLHRINPLALYFVVGTVESPNGPVGHAWLEYYNEDKKYWYIVDAAYAPGLYNFRKVISDKRYLTRDYKTTFVLKRVY